MLNGIGGKSIAEAKAALSYAEVLAWVAYRDKHGSLNLAYRGELAAAIVAQQVNRGAGGKADVQDFMPHRVQPGTALEQAMAEWA
ncbi:hypothetical protein HU719_006265 [Pseudomonas sp. SWRI107]|uniref:phage tail assembly protein T n=1 Tax=Pseudomonas farsensis TaxID=2745492 RepID=UPI001647B2F4|nr:hypothetical protein [Pseudomonas farsensis]